MTQVTFKALNNKLKKSIVLYTGVFLAERKKAFFKMMLYQVNNYYVEIYFFKAGKKPIWFRNFTSTTKLEPYLKKIDLSSIFEQGCVKN